MKVSDYLLRRLREWDVEHVFAYPGDGINGLLSAWGRADDKPRFIQARHEEMSAFEAVGYARFSGRVGWCAATSGPGAIQKIEKDTARWWEVMQRRAAVAADPINPEYVVIAADSGSAANGYARHVRMRGHIRGSPDATREAMPRVRTEGRKGRRAVEGQVAVVADGTRETVVRASRPTVLGLVQEVSFGREPLGTR
jgi:hypothetical protein